MNEPMTDERYGELRAEAEVNILRVKPAELTEALDEIRRLREELADERRFCICGCPMDGHENYGEDGLSCDNPDHECVLVCAAAAQIAIELHEENERLKECLDAIIDAPISDKYKRARELLKEANLRLPNIDDLKRRICALLDREKDH